MQCIRERADFLASRALPKARYLPGCRKEEFELWSFHFEQEVRADVR